MEILFGRFGSPRFQFHPVMFPGGIIVERSAKTVGEFKHVFCVVNEATGGGFTIAGRRVVLWQLLFDTTVRITLYVPEAVYVMQGFCILEILFGRF